MFCSGPGMDRDTRASMRAGETQGHISAAQGPRASVATEATETEYETETESESSEGETTEAETESAIGTPRGQ